MPASPTLTADEINAMTDREYRALEARMRREAWRQGLQLHKSRRRNQEAPEWNTFRLTDPETNGVVAYGLSGGYGLGLDEVARFLTEEDQ